MKLFGTDGIRGRAFQYPLTPDFLKKIGRALPLVLKNRANKAVIGGDTRNSTEQLKQALGSGLAESGLTVRDCGVAPTPVIAYLVRSTGASFGVVISASHNPWFDNGIKIFDSKGFKLMPEFEQIIENKLKQLLQQNGQQGSIKELDWHNRYLNHITKHFKLNLKGISVVADLANGAGYHIAPKVFSMFNANLTVINDKPNGRNINENCGSEHPAALIESVKSEHADLGIGFDGDCDRAVFVDETGKLVNGDSIIAIIASWLKQKGKLKHNKIAVSIYSNLGLVKSLKKQGIEVVFTDVGDRWIAKKVAEQGLSLGGEMSGHIILPDIETTGNGIVTALTILSIMKETGKQLSELDFIELYPQRIINRKVKRKPPLESLPGYKQLVTRIEKELGERGRIFVRYSGTQPLLRIMVEAETEELINKYLSLISDYLRKQLGDE